MRKTLYYVILSFTLLISCQSDDTSSPEITVTSFSGRIEFENGAPVTNAQLSIGGIESTLFGAVAREGAILSIENGTFGVTIETEEDVSRYIIVIDVITENPPDRIAFDYSVGLQCSPGNCENFPPGQNYELTIIVPCTPNCVQLSS